MKLVLFALGIVAASFSLLKLQLQRLKFKLLSLQLLLPNRRGGKIQQMPMRPDQGGMGKRPNLHWNITVLSFRQHFRLIL